MSAEDSESRELEVRSSKSPTWRFFIIWVIVGSAPLLPLLLSQPILTAYNCHSGVMVSCSASGWVLSLANAVYGISWLVLFTFPLALVAFIVGIFKFIKNA